MKTFDPFYANNHSSYMKNVSFHILPFWAVMDALLWQVGHGNSKVYILGPGGLGSLKGSF